MKLRYPALLLVSAALLPLSSQAQLLADWEIIKGIDYVQTSATDPIVKTGNSYFWESLFKANGGDTVLTSPAPNTAIPNGTGGTQTHTFDSGDSEWGASLNNISHGGLDTLVGNGTFTTNITFGTAGAQSGTLNLNTDGSGIDYFAANPKLTTLTNAAWSGGKLYVTAGTIATIGFNGTSVIGFTNAQDVMDVSIDGQGSKNQTPKFGSFTIGSSGDFNLVAGTYEPEIEYVNYTDVHTSNFPGSTGRAGFLNNVLVELVVVSAVPEPSSYALLGGIIALGFGATRRRRTA